jgi:hypothetical protein
MQRKERIYLTVSFAEKDEAKKLGASWDPYSKGWFVLRTKDLAPFKSWLPDMYNPELKPPYLECLFIPKTTWFQNARSHLMSSEWFHLSKNIIENSANRCEICGYRHPKYELECHEDWDFHYDSKKRKHIQRLKRLVAICQPCHRAIHFSKAKNDKLEKLAHDQLTYVNSWTKEQADKHIKQAYKTWEQRNQHQWELDLSYLENFGIDSKLIVEQLKEREGFLFRKIDHAIAKEEARLQSPPPSPIKKPWLPKPTPFFRKSAWAIGMILFIASYISIGRLTTPLPDKTKERVCKTYYTRGNSVVPSQGTVCQDAKGNWRFQR